MGEVIELFEKKAKTHLSSEKVARARRLGVGNPNAIPCRQMHFQLRLRSRGGQGRPLHNV